jgi:hypothetical protein
VILHIIDLKQNQEQFKNNLSYTQRYLNDPNNLIKYIANKENDEKKSEYSIDKLTSINKIQSNEIVHGGFKNKMSQSIKQKHSTQQNKFKHYVSPLQQTKKYVNYGQDVSPITTHSNINNGKIYFNTNIKNSKIQSNPNLQNTKEEIYKNDVFIGKNDFNVKSNKKTPQYKLYHDSLFTPTPAPKLYSEKRPIVDQTINVNIKKFVDQGKQSVPIDYANTSNIPSNELNLNNINMKGKTIKEIYDTITQDGRLDLQKNLDDLEAFDDRKDYKLGEKYGSTRFDTYALG